MDQSVVWVRITGEGYVLARIGELFGHNVEVVPIDGRLRKQMCSLDDILPAGDPSKDVDDNCELMFLNVATLLNNITLRYRKGKIYTYVANILLAVNPYRDTGKLYDEATIKSYQGKSLGVMPPHIFAIADKSYRDMKSLKQSQSIIISGESGAGKTESTKYILKYLCSNWKKTAGPLEQKILDATPILEAFGNAKTMRNNNSSRFGKFMEVHYNNDYQVVGGHISHYLLEKTRVCMQSPEERNYHIFYLLCAGAPPELRKALRLTNPDDFLYLKNGCTQYFTSPATESKLNADQKSEQQTARGGLGDRILDDVQEFQRLHQELLHIGLSEAECMGIYSMVAAVLHLGNVQFEEDSEDTRGGCSVQSCSEPALELSAQLLGVDPNDLRMSLCWRLMQSAMGSLKGTTIMVAFKIYEAERARNALAKALYARLFDLVMGRVNASIPFQTSTYYIGVLDIPGFEYFTINNFEQFCINYSNEKLQYFFNERILENEQELYRREGLNVPEISFVNNRDCIDLFESKASGIFSLLNEETKLPKPDIAYFTHSVHKQWRGKASRLQLPRTSRLKAHRALRDDEGFLVRHFAGSVCYDTKQFIEKNNDALHASLEFLMQESSSELVQQMFCVPTNGYLTKGKLNFISVGSKFQTQLAQLMDKLKQNGTNFVRCIKPNSHMVSGHTEGALVLTQLQCSGTVAVLELMEHGYPSRASFNYLHALYSAYLSPEQQNLSPKEFCESVVNSFHLSEKDYKLGVSRVFFRPNKYFEFDTMIRTDPENLKTIVDAVTAWQVKSRWRKSIFSILCIIKLKNQILYRRQCLITIQKHVRGYLVLKQHRPRYLGILKIRILENNLKEMEQVVEQQKENLPDSKKDIEYLRTAIQIVCKLIKSDPNITKHAINALYVQLQRQTNTQITSLHKTIAGQNNSDEQEWLQRKEEEMRVHEEARRLEEQKLSEDEDNRRLKAEMESRRKDEEAERLKQAEAVRAEALRIQQQRQLAEQRDRQERERLEQERQDHEMAARLAKETNGHVEGSPPQFRRSESVNMQKEMQDNQKYDLSKWTYAELRKTINTSYDIDLLEACRQEFHRRLKVYHAWKAKNQKKTTMGDTERAPKSIMDAAANSPRVQQKREILGLRHRYFRIQFVRPSATGSSESVGGNEMERRGWWYAHFDGQYVARQMELHPDNAPVLLQSGIHDMQMTELSLEETGLTRKRGAEILQHEFEREWTQHGGPTYFIKPNEVAKNN